MSAASEEALHRFIGAFPSQRVSISSNDPAFSIAYTKVATDRFTIHRMRCSGGLRAVGPLPEAVAVGRRTSGTLAITGAGRAIDTSQPYLRPIASTEFRIRDAAAVMLVALPPASVAEYMERSGERGGLVNRLETAPHLAALGLVMEHAATVLDEPDALAERRVDELHDLLCWALLHAFEDPWAETNRSGARSSALRRAMRYIDEHADGLVTMPEVAEAARVSTRTLGLLFRRELDTTPLRWLHDLRLDRARLDLLDGGRTVNDVATRHGMPNPGRFAAQYRARFGELPTDTLRGTPLRGP